MEISDSMRFFVAGEKSLNIGWTNEELDDQIKVLNCVINYLTGRGDSSIVIRPLKMDLELFKSMRNLPKDKTTLRRLTPREYERLQGIPDDYAVF